MVKGGRSLFRRGGTSGGDGDSDGDVEDMPGLLTSRESSSERTESPSTSDDDSSSCCGGERPPQSGDFVLTEGGDDDYDPYSDVRLRMEWLSREDREKHSLGGGGDEAEAEIDAKGGKGKGGLHFGVGSGAGGGRVGVDESAIPFFAAVTTYLGYMVLIFVGHIRDVCATIFRKGRYLQSQRSDARFPSDDLGLYAPLLKSWENFYTRRLYHRIQDCFNRPIASRPGAVIHVLERVSSDGNKTMTVLGNPETISTYEDRREAEGESAEAKDVTASESVQGLREEYESGPHYMTVSGNRVARRCLNLGSYNYLGFADDWDETCRSGVLRSLEDLPVSSGSSRSEFGTTALHAEVENLVAEFVGKESAVVLNMGFNTNATAIPTLALSGDLLVSDELNHTSIVNGARASGASIRTFRHNDPSDLESILRTAIVMGRPRTRRPWNKILVVVEGIYSMEGEYCDLPGIVAVCKRYGAYVYLDEAHSIGAMGATGRGCCEYTGVDPADIDVLMGTFTKSFGGMGGYIAGSKEVVEHLRKKCAGSVYHNSLSPVVCQQILSSFKVSSREGEGERGVSRGRGADGRARMGGVVACAL